MQFIDLKRQYKEIEASVNQRIQDVLNHGAYIKGPEIAELEEQLASFVGVKHAMCVSSGTTALQVALMALGVGEGDEVIVPSFSFFATSEVVMLLGAIPVMIDIDPVTYNLDVTQLESLITSRTKAIMPVSLYGLPANFKVINEIAGRHGVAVIEDGAQSFGATYQGKRSCGLSTIGATSFFPSKPLGGYGDGGAIFCDDDHLADLMRSILDHGQSERYKHARIGINGRLSTIQAAILLEKLRIFPQEIDARKHCADLYAERLSEHFVVPAIVEGSDSVYAQYTLRVSDREMLVSALKAQGIPTAVHYPMGMHQQVAYENYMKDKGLDVTHQVFPETEKASEEVLSLPFHPYLTEDQIDQICAALIAIELPTGA